MSNNWIFSYDEMYLWSNGQLVGFVFIQNVGNIELASNIDGISLWAYKEEKD